MQLTPAKRYLRISWCVISGEKLTLNTCESFNELERLTSTSCFCVLLHPVKGEWLFGRFISVPSSSPLYARDRNATFTKISILTRCRDSRVFSYRHGGVTSGLCGGMSREIQLGQSRDRKMRAVNKTRWTPTTCSCCEKCKSFFWQVITSWDSLKTVQPNNSKRVRRSLRTTFLFVPTCQFRLIK